MAGKKYIASKVGEAMKKIGCFDVYVNHTQGEVVCSMRTNDKEALRLAVEQAVWARKLLPDIANIRYIKQEEK